MAVNLRQIPRAEKRGIAQKIFHNLEERLAKGAPEPALDAYIVELSDVVTTLDTHVAGSVTADAERTARLARLEVADDDVDRWYRHVEGYVNVESRRRTSPDAKTANALHDAAFPDGLEHIDDFEGDENRVCADALAVLRSPEYAPTLKAIELPTAWLDRWESAIAESDAALFAVQKARTDKRGHVDAGRDVETEWVELMVRLRKYVGSRAKRSDVARVNEGKVLLAPLLDTMAKLKAETLSRATRKAKAKTEAQNGESDG